jgi:hypothetical protein
VAVNGILNRDVSIGAPKRTTAGRPCAGAAPVPDMTNARLLSLFLFLLCIPAAGLFPFLGFTGSWVAAIAAAAVIVVFAVWIVRTTPVLAGHARYDILLFALAVSFALCILGGEGRFFYANEDWLIRDAILNDLVSQHWPFVYPLSAQNFAEQDFVMRAPLAMYIMPALVGKLAGLYGAHLALLVQDTVLFALILYFLVPLNSRFGYAAGIISIFTIFSGLDVLPALLGHMHAGITPRDHLEAWAGLFQYSSHITQLFWVPHHAIGGWTFACFYLLWQRQQIPVFVLTIAFFYLAFWSTFAAMGAAPFLFYAGASDLLGRKIRIADIALSALVILPALPVLLYLSLSSGSVPRGYLFYRPDFWEIYPMFVGIEFIPYVVLTAAMKPEIIKEPTFLLVTICLLLIPFYSLGASNDFAMRTSIPALALLAGTFAVVLTDSLATRHSLGWATLATLILLIGGITGTMEVRRALVRSPLPISRCNFVEVWRQSPFGWIPMTSYLVSLGTLPPWMRPQSPASVPPSGLDPCFAS